jgi:hypothetical protein
MAGVGHALQAWAGPVQAAAIVLFIPILLIFLRQASRTAAASARLAAAGAEAAEATKQVAMQSEEALRGLQAAKLAESAPYVIAYLDITEEHLVYAVVKNLGQTPARDVVVHFDPPLLGNGALEQPWDVPAFLSAPIPFFPPRYELRSIIGLSLDLFAADSRIPKLYRAEISYADAITQARHEQSYTLDLGVFRNARSGRATGLADIQAILKELSEEQQSLVAGVEAVHELLASTPVVSPSALRGPDPQEGEAPSAELAEPAPEPSNDSSEPPPATIAKTIAELCQDWRTLSDRRRWESAGSLQQRLRALRDEWMAGPSTLPPSPMLDAALGHRFFLDGGESLKSFDTLVDRLIETCQLN